MSFIESDDSLPRLLGGRYRLEAKLGSGGMGVVYRASDLTMKRQVAVKLIRGVDGIALDEEVASRFLREAKNTARIQHENIIEVYDFGRSEDDDMFFVMELLEGESLSAKLRREGKLSPEVGVHVVRQMCAALQVAHAADIIHRDLKPANVMLLVRARDPHYVKVLDFGVAKSYAPDQETDLTHTGMLVGTVEYMAPEQIMGRKVDGRTDIYALGVLMYKMFAGKAPFRDGGVPALIHAHLNVTPKPIAESVRDIPDALDRVVQRCLAKRPEQRYQSMDELSRALAAAVQPDDLGLMSLEYVDSGENDVYAGGDKTEVARPGAGKAVPAGGAEPVRDAPKTVPPRPASRAPRPAEPAPARAEPKARDAGNALDRAPVLHGAEAFPEPAFEDATIKLERRDVEAGRFKGLAGDAPQDRTEVMPREEIAAAKQQLLDDVTRIDRDGPRECAMCRTVNPAHARACTACGISLAQEEQAAVRARVTAPRPPSVPPRTAHLSAPRVPPPTSGAFPSPHAAQGPSGFPPSGHTPHPSQGGWSQSPPQGIPNAHGMQPGMPLPQSGSIPSVGYPMPAPNAPPTSVWQRFLSWAGLRR